MKISEASGIVIDGFPRDVGQALSFEDQVSAFYLWGLIEQDYYLVDPLTLKKCIYRVIILRSEFNIVICYAMT